MTGTTTPPMLSALTKKGRPMQSLQRVRTKNRRGCVDGTEPRCLPLSGVDLDSVLRRSTAYASGVIHQMREYAAVWSPGMDGVDPVQGVMLDEKREVFLHPVDLQIAQAATMLTLRPHLETVFDPLSFAYRPGRSVPDAQYAARVYSRTRPFAAKADIRRFFPNTHATKVLTALRWVFPELDASWDRWVAYLMSSSIYRLAPGAPDPRNIFNDGWEPKPVRHPHPHVLAGSAPEFEHSPMHILQGSVLGPMLSNIVGHVMVDVPMRALRPEVVCLRYADDMLLLGSSAGTVEDALGVLGAAVEKWGYQLHPEKTSTVPLDLRESSISWLGKEVSRGRVHTPDEWVMARAEEALSHPAFGRKARAVIGDLLHQLSLDDHEHVASMVNHIGWASMDHLLVLEDLFRRNSRSRQRWLHRANTTLPTLRTQ